MSTGRTGTINQALGIALIVFVMLTFILMVTTYVFFGKQLAAGIELDTSNTDLTAARAEVEKKTGEYRSLADFIGKVEEKPIETVEEADQLFTSLFPDYDEKAENGKTFQRGIEILKQALVEKDSQLKASQAAQMTAEETAKKAADDLANEKKQFEEKVKAIEDDLAKSKADAEKKRAEFEETEKTLVDEKQKVLDQVEGLKLLSEQIAAGEGLVGPKAFEEKDDKTRVGLLLKTIRDRNKTIDVLERSEILRSVAAVDPKVQVYVLEALGATASEIETLKPLVRRPGFGDQEEGNIDGRIVAVDQRERSVTIACDSTFGVRPGLVFNVHPGTLPAGSNRSVKAVVEVVEVDGGSLVRGRIRRDSIQDPIIAGDIVSTPLWSPGRPIEAVVVGFVDLDGDGKEDTKAFEDLVARGGGTVVRTAGNSTTVLVDAGKPASAGDGGSQRAVLKPADEKRRTAELAEARALGIRVLTLDAFLDWLGAVRPTADRDAITAPGPARVPPTRTDLSY